MTAEALLAAFQLGDSALPIGRFAHSLGLEALLSGDAAAGEHEIREIVETLLLESAGPLDGAAVALAHRTGCDLASQLELDRAVTARKVSRSCRLASTSCGRRLAALVPQVWSAPAACALAGQVAVGATDGNLAVVEGVLARDLGIDCRTAVLLELRGVAAGLLSVPVRLGRLSASRSQVALASLRGTIEAAAEIALGTDAAGMRSFAPELEIAAMAHARHDARLFRT